MFTLLRERSFLIVWIGHAASSLGNTFSGFALAWLVYFITGSKLAMGSMMVVFMISRSISLLWFGPYIDKWNKKLVMVFSQFVGGLTFVFPFIMYLVDAIQIWHLVFILALSGLIVPLYQPSALAYIAQIVPKEQLLKANSLIDSTAQFMLLIGPVLSGIMLYALGAEAVLLALILLLCSSGIILLFAKSIRIEHITQESWSKKFKTGLRFYKTNRFLLWMALLLVILNFCKGAFFPMFLPFITEVIGGTTIHFGFFESCLGLGMIFGTLWVGFRKAAPKNLRNIMLGSVIIDGLFSIVLGLVPVYAISLVCIMISGFCMPVMTVNNTTLYQKHVPQELMGRVFAVRILLTTIATPLGAIFGGMIAEFWGIPVLFSFVGLIMITSASLAFLIPSLRQVNDAPLENKPATI